MNYIIVLFSIIIFYGFVFSQNHSIASVSISAKLIYGIQIEKIQNDLNFGEIILPVTNQNIEINPSNGIRFKIKSNPNKFVFINYYDIILNKESPQSLSTNDQILFVPLVISTGAFENYINPIQVISGNAYEAENVNGLGLLNIWLGGKLNLTSQNSAGNFSGTFVLNISY